MPDSGHLMEYPYTTEEEQGCCYLRTCIFSPTAPMPPFHPGTYQLQQ